MAPGTEGRVPFRKPELPVGQSTAGGGRGGHTEGRVASGLGVFGFLVFLIKAAEKQNL